MHWLPARPYAIYVMWDCWLRKGAGHPPQDVRDVVVALCAVRPWRVDELSAVLRRNPEVVRQNYLRPLMREGRLIMTHPEEPNDRQQSYVAV